MCSHDSRPRISEVTEHLLASVKSDEWFDPLEMRLWVRDLNVVIVRHVSPEPLRHDVHVVTDGATIRP